jgi:2-keto-4-pentenoate hydratase
LQRRRGTRRKPAGRGAGGEIVTLGSLVKTLWVDKGDEIVAEFDDLGRIVLVMD